jgi:hypothetical protein
MWEGNITIDLEETGREGLEGIKLAQRTHQWWALMNTVINIRIP